MAGSRINVPDDYGNTANAANVGTLGSEGSSGVGVVARGYISAFGDHDFFRVWLEAGNYTLEALPVDSNRLPRSKGLMLLTLAEGVSKKIMVDPDLPSGPFSIASAGWYSVDVWSGCYLCSGNYSFKFQSFDPTALGGGLADLPANPASAVSLPIGQLMQGQLSLDYDSDAFKVELEAGKTYYFTLDGDPSYKGGAGGTAHVGYAVNDPVLSLFGPDWNGSGAALQVGTDTQGSWNDRVVYKATQSGTHYLVTSGKGFWTTGDFIVSYLEAAPEDWVGVADLQVNEAPKTGKIQVPGDTDMFAVTLTAGVSYMLRANAYATPGSPGLGDPLLFLLDASQNPIFYNDNKKGDPMGAGSGAQRNDSLIIYTPTTTGTFHLAVQGIGNTMGQYQVSAIAMDDAVASTATPQRIFINGGSVGGNIEIPGDSDWYSVYLSAGATYTFDARSAGTEPLSDPLLYLRDARGVAVAVNDNASGLDAQLRFTAVQSGMYFLDVQDASNGTGRYTVSAQSGDDHAANVKTSALLDLTSGAGASGRIDFGGDVDWIAVDLQLNQSYGIHVLGAGAGGGLSLADPRLLGIYDASGAMVYNSGNDDHGTSRNAFVRFTAPSAGRYFLAVAGSTLEDLGSYRVQVSAQARSDAQASAQTRHTLAAGAATQGSIEFAGDKDWYAVDLMAGTSYVIDLLGDVTSTQVLRDAVLGGVYDASGAEVAAGNNNYGASLNSRLVFKPVTSATYFVEARGNTGHTGDYQLSIKALGTTADAIGSSVQAHGLLSLQDGGGAVSGTVDVARDVDWYRVSLAAGKDYEITLRGAASGKGTLLDPRLYGIYDAAGALILGTAADAGDGGVDVRTSFRPQASGVFYLAAGGTADLSGSYELELRTVVSTNDVAPDMTTTASLISGAAYQGELETVGDVDWIRVDLAANQRVTLELKGIKGSLGKLLQPAIANVFNAQGEAILLAASSAGDFSEKKTFLSERAGTYYVQVQSHANAVGDYRLQVSEKADSNRQDDLKEVPSPELLGNYIDQNPDKLTYYSKTVATDGVITLQFGAPDQFGMNYLMYPVEMAKGSGNIYISGANQFLTIDVNSDQVQVYGDTVVINPDVDFLPNQEYAMFMDAGVLTDAGGVAFQGIGVERRSKYWGLVETGKLPGYSEYMWKTDTVNDPNEFLFMTSAAPAAPKDDWTLMVYMAADNELESQALMDLQEMFAASLPAHVNLVVMIDRAEGYDSSGGDWKGAYQGQVSQGMTVADVAGSWTSLGEVNTGSASTLQTFVQSVKSNTAYAADRYGLVVWGPGGGITGMAWDDSQGMDQLSLVEFGSALSAAGLTANRSFSETIVGFPEAYSRVDQSKFRLTSATLGESRSDVQLAYSRGVYDLKTYTETVSAIKPLLGAFKFTLDNGATWHNPVDWSVSGNIVSLELGQTVAAGQTLTVKYDSAYRPVYKHEYKIGYGQYGWNAPGYNYLWMDPAVMEAASAPERRAEFSAIRSYAGSGAFHFEDGYNAASFELSITDSKLDLLAFDSSTMGLVETLWQVAGNAHTLVASEDTVPFTGFDYKTWLESLAANAQMSSAQFGRELVDSYFAQNAGGISTSIAAYDLSDMQIRQEAVYVESNGKTHYYQGFNNLLFDINDFADYALTSGSAADWQIIQQAALRVMSSPTHDVVVDHYRDLSDFFQYLSTRLNSTTLRNLAKEAFETVVATATYAKTGDSGSAGLGIYLPVNAPVDGAYVDNAAGAAGTNANFLFLTNTWYVNGSGVASYPQWDEFVQKVQTQVANTAPSALVLTPLASAGVPEVTAPGGRLEKDLKVATLAYTDTDGWTRSNVFEITGPDSARFNVIGDGLYLRSGTDLDFESAVNTDHAYTVTVTVKDPTLATPSGLGATQSLTVQVNNVDELAPVISSAASARVVESASNNPLVYQTVASDDLGSAQLRFSLHPSDDHASFAIDAASGAVSFKGVLDYETRDLYRFTVVAEDASGKRAQQTVDFRVGNAADGGSDTRGPSAILFTPADNASAVALNSSIVVTFNEAIKLGAGSIVLKTLSGQSVQTFSASASAGLSIVNSDSENARLTVNPSAQLLNNTTYILEFQANSVLDLANNAMAAKSDYNFRTIKGIAGVTTQADDTVGASASGLVLPTGVAAQPLDGDIVLQLSEAVQRGVGSIQLVRHFAGAPDQTVETFDVASSPLLSIDTASQTLRINPIGTLKAGTGYSVVIEPSALLDAAGNPLASSASQVDFTAAAGSGFDIELIFESTTVAGGWTEALEKPYHDAVQRLEQIIVGDLPDIRDAQGNLLVDDLVIRINELSGMDKLGEGGPTVLRSAADGGLPSQGIVNMDRGEVTDFAKSFIQGSDANDLQTMVDLLMKETIIHEVAHVLGMGPLWENFGLNTVRGKYAGPNAVAAYREMINDPSVLYIPLEIWCGPGTDNVHWREDVFGSEVMTGLSQGPGAKISRLTIAGLEDLGYEVNYAAADEYSVAGAAVKPVLNMTNTGAKNLYMDHAVI